MIDAKSITISTRSDHDMMAERAPIPPAVCSPPACIVRGNRNTSFSLASLVVSDDIWMVHGINHQFGAMED